MDDHDYSGDNLEEAEMGQLHAMHLNMNAVAEKRREMELQALSPSLENCEECGDDIPEARRLAVPGCKLCIYCKQVAERR